MGSSGQHINPPDEQIKEILQKYNNVAVVGLSSNQTRPSYAVAEYLQRKGFKIIPVNPNETEILGEKAYPNLDSVPERVQVVDIFRRSEHVPPIVDEAIKIGAKVVWMQVGVVNHAAAIKASQSGLAVIVDRCIYRDHRTLFK